MNVVEPGKVLVLSENDCRAILTDEKVLEVTEQALADYSNGVAINPIKLHLPLFPENNGWINSMPCWLKRQNVTGMKWVNVHGDNARKYHVPTVMGTCILNDPATGIPFAIVDGTSVTALRTGAAAALMAKYCCKKGSSVLSIVGAGVQGFNALVMTMIAIPGIKTVRVMDIRPESQQFFIKKALEKYPNLHFEGVSDIQNACTGADIIIMAAHADHPLLTDIKLDKGCTVVGISESVNKETRKKYDRVIMDYIACVVHRMNQTSKYMHELYNKPLELISEDIADGEIGDVITGKFPGRANDNEIVFAEGVGMGIEDISVAYEVYQRAVEKGMGTKVELFNTL